MAARSFKFGVHAVIVWLQYGLLLPVVFPVLSTFGTLNIRQYQYLFWNAIKSCLVAFLPFLKLFFLKVILAQKLRMWRLFEPYLYNPCTHSKVSILSWQYRISRRAKKIYPVICIVLAARAGPSYQVRRDDINATFPLITLCQNSSSVSLPQFSSFLPQQYWKLLTGVEHCVLLSAPSKPGQKCIRVFFGDTYPQWSLVWKEWWNSCTSSASINNT